MRRILPSVLLLFAGISVALALAEGLVRIFAPHSRDHVVPAGMFEIDAVLGWKLHARSDVRHRTRYFDVRYSINSMGFRDPPRIAAMAKGKRRVLFFGDSQIFGWGVSPDQRTSALVEAGSPSTEAWNMGVPGYGLDQEILSYERNGGSLGATDVMFFVSTFTLRRTNDSYLYRKAKPKFTLDSTGNLLLTPIPAKASALTDLMYRVLSPFYLPYFVELQLKRRTDPDALTTLTRNSTLPTSPAIVRLQMALLLKARAIAVERNQRMIVLASLPAASSRELRDFCSRNGIVFIETPRSVASSQLIFGKYDKHWNPRAHQLVADRLRAMLDSTSGVYLPTTTLPPEGVPLGLKPYLLTRYQLGSAE